jgi:hypothetical protein
MRQYPVACFNEKQVGLGFPSLASKLVEEQQQMVLVASLWRSHGREAKNDRFDGVGCGTVKVRPNYPSVVVYVVFISAHMGIQVFFCFCM